VLAPAAAAPAIALALVARGRGLAHQARSRPRQPRRRFLAQPSRLRSLPPRHLRRHQRDDAPRRPPRRRCHRCSRWRVQRCPHGRRGAVAHGKRRQAGVTALSARPAPHVDPAALRRPTAGATESAAGETRQLQAEPPRGGLPGWRCVHRRLWLYPPAPLPPQPWLAAWMTSARPPPQHHRLLQVTPRGSGLDAEPPPRHRQWRLGHRCHHRRRVSERRETGAAARGVAAETSHDREWTAGGRATSACAAAWRPRCPTAERGGGRGRGGRW
jgi:hypothetical protein